MLLLFLFLSCGLCALPPANTLSLLDEEFYPNGRAASQAWGRGSLADVFDDGVDAVFQRSTGKIYFFQGTSFYRLTDRYLFANRSNSLDEGYPKTIQSYWGLPYWVEKVDAIFTRPNGKIYLFSGKWYWRYEDQDVYDRPVHRIQKYDIGYPKLISENFIGVPDDLEGAMFLPNGYMYFFKGSQMWRIRDKYFYPEVKEDIVDLCYPKSITSEFERFPRDDDYTPAFGSPKMAPFWRHSTNQKVYFFFGSIYYRYEFKYLLVENAHRNAPFELVESGYDFPKVPDLVLDRYNGETWLFFDHEVRKCTERFHRTYQPTENRLECWDSESYNVTDLFVGIPSRFVRFDAGFVSNNGRIYIFHDNYFWSFVDSFLYPTGGALEDLGQRIPLTHLGLPSSVRYVDAAYEAADGSVYVIVGEWYYKLSWTAVNQDTVDPDFPWAFVDPGYPYLVNDWFFYLPPGAPYPAEIPSRPFKSLYQRRSTGVISFFLWVTMSGYSQFDAPDKNLFLADDCTNPWPECYSSYECPPSEPFCENRGTKYAQCVECRTSADCAHLVDHPVCDVRGFCKASDVCNGNEDVYPIGNADPLNGFVFFVRNLAHECCKEEALKVLTEGAVRSPTWMTLDALPTLYDPLDLGYMGLRNTRTYGAWDGLYSMGFVVSAKDAGELDPIDTDQVYTLLNSDFADTCEREWPASWLPSPPEVWSGAKSVASAGRAALNNQFWYEVTEHYGAFDVRVYWDCTFADRDECARTITITNLRNTTLNDVRLAQSWDFDMTPTPSDEALTISRQTTAIEVGPVRKASADLLTDDGEVFLNAAAIDTANNCGTWSNVNVDIPWNYNVPSGSRPRPCDAGATALLHLGSLAPLHSVSVTTHLRVFQSLSTFQSWRSQRDFAAASRPFDNPDTSNMSVDIIAVGFDLTDVQRSFLIDPAVPGAYLAGDCPCIGAGVTSNCTYDSIRGPCVCDDKHFGTFCEYECVNGVWDTDAELCDCEQGWWGRFCEHRCTCERGSWCDQADGVCYCKNGLVGRNCDKVHTCAKGQQ